MTSPGVSVRVCVRVGVCFLPPFLPFVDLTFFFREPQVPLAPTL